ncbi:hypothetical protein SAY86_025620 [Trapa natans]|uniref:Uncharacterized protein n=1 Tax=Trapa natans TaxID=22666 RepID=A0AAN7KKB6_TRANT|nr:hypothetical protein SAY86_025620 [Trapa natans]
MKLKQQSGTFFQHPTEKMGRQRKEGFSKATNRRTRGKRMQRKNTNKRGRDFTEEEDGQEKIVSQAPERTSKKAREEEETPPREEDDALTEGVFDFPWLKEEGEMVSALKDYYCEFESTFLSTSVDAQLCDEFPPWIPTNTMSGSLLKGDEKEKEWAFQGDKLESFDCIWNLLLDQKHVAESSSTARTSSSSLPLVR